MARSKKIVAEGADQGAERPKALTAGATRPRVVIYCRRSQDDGDATRSLPEQEALCRRFAEEVLRGAVVRCEHENRSGVSGFDRPKFLGLVQAAERGEFDVLVTLDISRLGRFTADERGYWVTKFARAGVRVRHALDDDRLQGEAAPVMAAVLQTGAREHSINVSRRTAMGQVAAVERGCWPGSAPPYGYRIQRRPGWDGRGRKDARLVVVETEAAVVREAYRLAGTGLGRARVAGVLNAAGHRTRSGRRWTVAAVRRMLSHPAYRGDLIRGQGTTGATFFHGTATGPRRVDEDGPRGVVARGILPAIVTSDLWDRVQAKTAERRAEPTGGEAGLLAGLLRCGACGGPLLARTGRTYMTAAGERRRYAYLGCKSYDREGRPADRRATCGAVQVSRPRLEERVLRELRAAVSDLDETRLVQVIERHRAKRPTSDVAPLEAQRRRLEARRDQLVLADNGLPPEQVLAMVRPLAEQIEQVGRRIAEAKAAKATQADAATLARSVIRKLQCLRFFNDQEARPDEVRAAVRELACQVVVGPGRARSPRVVRIRVRTLDGLVSRDRVANVPPRNP